MDSITIDPTVYHRAEEYAREHNLSVGELVEHALVALFGNKEGYVLKGEEELSPSIRSLIGIAAGANTSDVNGRDAREEYLREKYETDITFSTLPVYTPEAFIETL